MTYAQALERLYSLQTRGVRLGLDRVKRGLALRGNPEKNLKIIQVAGTNGKGSVAAMIDACLRAAGYRCGLFTSPHLHRFVERIRVNGRPFAQRQARARIIDLLRTFQGPGVPELTFFELTTILALEVFHDRGCDFVVLEVGLGGRLDATTAAPAMLSVITHLAYDHTELLGTSIASIAREKAAIMRAGTPAIIGRCPAPARRVIRSRARALAAPCFWIDRDFSFVASERHGRWDARVGEVVVPDIPVALNGKHQLDNAVCAVAALVHLRSMGVEVPRSAIRRGIATVKWPGRLELMPGKPSFLFDAAHNPDGCCVLISYLAQRAEGKANRVLIFGAMRDKDYRSMLALLAPNFGAVFYAQPALPRAATTSELQKVKPGVAAKSIDDALARAKRRAGADGLVVAAGSIFLMSEVRARVLNLPSDPLIRM
jgi:dihydrofolate synthase / folylpolyglutamate synthase